MSSNLTADRYVYSFEEIDEDLEFGSALERQRRETGSPDDRPAISTPGCPIGEPGFWRRQFSPEATSRQRKFDWAIGVFLPLICFYFDPTEKQMLRFAPA